MVFWQGFLSAMRKIFFLYFFTPTPTIFCSGTSTDCVSVDLVPFDRDLLHETSPAFLWTYLYFCNLKMNFTAQVPVPLRTTSFMLWAWLIVPSLGALPSCIWRESEWSSSLFHSWFCEPLSYLPSTVFYPSLNVLLIFSPAFIFGTCVPFLSWFVTIILCTPIFLLC